MAFLIWTVMRDHPLNFEQLFSFSESLPYNNIPADRIELFEQLEARRVDLNFPAVKNDVGSIIRVLALLSSPKVIFEMGSGYGHSAFWFLLGAEKTLQKIVLTEKRSDLENEFNKLPWGKWSHLLEYHNDDAFKVLQNTDRVDIALIDGVKADYLSFLQELEKKMSPGGFVLIDNSYWRGSFLDESLVHTKKSAQQIKQLHDYIRETKKWVASFIPVRDGLSLLVKT